MTNHNKQDFKQVNISHHYNTSGDLSTKTGVKASFSRKPNVSEQLLGHKCNLNSEGISHITNFGFQLTLFWISSVFRSQSEIAF